jgi:hypothetical protein
VPDVDAMLSVIHPFVFFEDSGDDDDDDDDDGNVEFGFHMGDEEADEFAEGVADDDNDEDDDDDDPAANTLPGDATERDVNLGDRGEETNGSEDENDELRVGRPSRFNL